MLKFSKSEIKFLFSCVDISNFYREQKSEYPSHYKYFKMAKAHEKMLKKLTVK